MIFGMSCIGGVEALGQGQVVGIPTETVYCVAASALIPNAVDRVQEVVSNGAKSVTQTGQFLTLGIKGAEDAFDYIPDLSELAVRMARNYWPGPMILSLPGKHVDSVITRLPESVQKKIIRRRRASSTSGSCKSCRIANYETVGRPLSLGNSSRSKSAADY